MSKFVLILGILVSSHAHAFNWDECFPEAFSGMGFGEAGSGRAKESWINFIWSIMEV